MEDKKDRRALNRMLIPGTTAAYSKEIGLKIFHRFSKPYPVVNLSKSGICLAVRDHIKKGDRILVNVMIPGERNFQIIGEVLWHSSWSESDKYNVGIQFAPFGKGRNFNSMNTLERLRQISARFSA